MIINCAAMYMVPHLIAPVLPSAPRGIISFARGDARLYGRGTTTHQFGCCNGSVRMLARHGSAPTLLGV